MSVLAGTTVLDASRMLPGAVAAKSLLDLGARVIKVEAPRVGDPMRFAEPQVDGTGAAFAAFYGGAESICLDLKKQHDAAALRTLAQAADVMLESFRPGTLERWGVDLQRLVTDHPRLVVCSLSSFGIDAPDRVAHDINLVASSGLLSLLPGQGMPRVQIGDVATGLLATSAILAALLARASTGKGGRIDQPLSTGALPFLVLARAEQAAGGGGMADVLLSGACPAYRLYTCGDGKRIAVGAIEPKFWNRFVDLLGLPELRGVGLDAGTVGQRATKQVEETLAARTRDHWLALFEHRGLPVSPVLELSEAWEVSVPATRRAPHLGEQTKAVLAEFGIDHGPTATP